MLHVVGAVLVLSKDGSGYRTGQIAKYRSMVGEVGEAGDHPKVGHQGPANMRAVRVCDPSNTTEQSLFVLR